MNFAKDVVYLNYAATSFPKSRIALESFYAQVSSLPEGKRQHGSAAYLHELRRRVGDVLGIGPDFVFFTDSATLGLNQVIRGFAKEGDCLAIDNRSHNAVVRSWQSLANTCRCIVSPLYDEEDHFLEEALDETLSQAPKLLSLTHVSNVNGSIYPIERILARVRAVSPSTAVLIDASQSAGAMSLASLKEADFVVFPSHKHLHSVPGAAVLTAKRRLEPILFGGTGANSMAAEMLSDQDLFVEVGTMNLPAIQALVDSLEFAESMLQEHRAKESALVSQFIEGVKGIEGLRVLGRAPHEERLAIVALQPIFGSPELHWASFLKSQQIVVRGGLHCSPLHHEQLGLSKAGTLRFSFGWDSTAEHIENALLSLREFSAISQRIFV